MKLSHLLFTLLIGTTTVASAQEIYDVANIPAELLKKSTVVIRNEEQHLAIKSNSSAVMAYKTAITILSKNGENNAAMSEYYDKFSSVYNLKATMYDAKGVKIRTYKTSDFKDEASLLTEPCMMITV